jgi:subtilisin family serine protease
VKRSVHWVWLVVLAAGCGAEQPVEQGGGVGLVVSGTPSAHQPAEEAPLWRAGGDRQAFEPARYTSSLDRRQAWTPEAVESLLLRSQEKGDPLLLVLEPGVDADRLEAVPGLRVTGRHAFGIVQAEVLVPGRALADELIGLTELEVLALDDRLHTTEEAAGGVLAVDAGNDILVQDPIERNELGDAIATDPLYVNQWHLWGGPRESLGPFGESTPTSPGGANVPPAWGKLTDARSVTVAVLDTGADAEHIDLAPNLLEGEQVGLDGPVLVRPNHEDPQGHGTMVAGVIGAVGNNGLGTAGVCWRASILPIRVERDGVIRLSAVIDGISRASLSGARVINMSLGTAEANVLLVQAIEAARQRKVLVVASAGNDGVNLDVDPRYPASIDLPNVITVAALDREGNLADFSNYGRQTVDIAAPGVEVFTTFPGNRIAIPSGTSFSAPMVAGTLALIYAKHPDRGMRFARERLLENARQPEALRGKVAGRRQLDCGRAVRPKQGKRN